MQRSRMMLAVVLVGVVCAGALPAAAQPVELEEVGRSEIRPGSGGGDAEIAVVVAPGAFAGAWLEVQRLIIGHGGTVVSATAVTAERPPAPYGVAEARIPADRIGVLVGELASIGEAVEGTFSRTDGPVANLVVSVSESPGVIGGVAPVDTDSTLGRAFDTAARVVLTILSVVIIVGAAVVPVVILALVGYGTWRWIRHRVEPQVPVARPEAREPEPVDH